MTTETLKAFCLTHGKFQDKDGKKYKKGDTVLLTASQAKNFANMLAKVESPVAATAEPQLQPTAVPAEPEEQSELDLEAPEENEETPTKDAAKESKPVGKPLKPGVKK